MKPAFINSLPKSGTHLTAKCLKLMGYEERYHFGSGEVINRRFISRLRRLSWIPFNQGFQVGIDTPVEVSKRAVIKRLRSSSPNSFFTGHVGYSSGLLDTVLNHGISPILIHRDPRAVLVSFVHYVARLKKHVLHKEFNALSEKEQFLSVLKGHRFKHVYLESLRTRCMSLDSWLASDDVLKIRFEDLVGEKGGGSAEAQRNTLQRVCDWLEISTSHIDKVIEELFGPGRHTFRKGQVDSWKEELPPDMIELTEKTLKDVLHLWGYDSYLPELERQLP